VFCSFVVKFKVGVSKKSTKDVENTDIREDGIVFTLVIGVLCGNAQWLCFPMYTSCAQTLPHAESQTTAPLSERKLHKIS